MSIEGPLEVRSQLIEVKRLLVEAMADEQRLYQGYSKASREAQRWRGRAELALGRGSEELARAALERARKQDEAASRIHEQYLAQKEQVEGMKLRLRQLEEPSGPRPGRVGSREPGPRVGPPADWEVREERAREERARLVAWAELERDELKEKLDALEREDLLDRQLAELKQRLGKS